VYHKTTLENGIRIITNRMSGVRSVSIGILFDVGPRDDPADRLGLAHMTEHMMFAGTSNRDAAQIARLMDEGGGSIGAFTARDYTCYFSTVLDEYSTYAMDLLGDLLLNSIVPPENLEREKQAVLSEMEMAGDVPYQRAHELLKSFAWPSHPLGNPIIGLPESVDAISRDDVIYFMHQHYLPNRMIIAAAGNVDHLDFVALARDSFWRMLGESVPQPLPIPDQGRGVKIEHMPVSQTYFCLGLQAPPYAHPDRYAVHLLNNVLGGGSSSRLYRKLRDEHGLVYSISSEYHAYLDDGLIVIEGSTPPQHLTQVLALILEESRNLLDCSQPVDEEELRKAKMQIRGTHLIGSERTDTQMSRLATQEFYFGRQIPTKEIVEQIELIDLDHLHRLSRTLLLGPFQQTKIALVGPDEAQRYSADSIEQLLAGCL
jgi:predicted Zn-dependent peptidase